LLIYNFALNGPCALGKLQKLQKSSVWANTGNIQKGKVKFVNTTLQIHCTTSWSFCPIKSIELFLIVGRKRN